MAQDFLCYAAQHHPPEARPTMRTDNDQVHLHRLRGRDDLLGSGSPLYRVKLHRYSDASESFNPVPHLGAELEGILVNGHASLGMRAAAYSPGREDVQKHKLRFKLPCQSGSVCYQRFENR